MQTGTELASDERAENSLFTTTCGSAAGGAPVELPLAPGECLSHAPRNTIPARPAATHSLAGVRPRIRRPLVRQ